MAYEDVYNPDTSRYRGVSGQSVVATPPLPVDPTSAYYGGYMDKGDLQASTSTLRSVTSALKEVLGQVSGAISSTLGALRGAYTSLASRPQQGTTQDAYHASLPTNISPEVGRYIGSSAFLGSARAAFTGEPGSPYLLESDYQQLMSDNFARRSTLLGGAVASTAAEMAAWSPGSKLLGPLLGGGTIGGLAGGLIGSSLVGLAASHVMGRVNQGLEFDSLLQDTSARLGINEGGPLSHGFSPYHRQKISRLFMRMTARERREQGGLDSGDYADVMEYGLESGLFNEVTNSEQFTGAVKSAAKQVKALMKVLREPDVRDAIKDMSTFKQWGVPQDQMVSFAMHANAVGRAIGVTSQGMMGYMSAGAQMAQQMGLSGVTGANLTQSGMLIGRSMLRSGVVSPEDMARATGGGGANEYGNKIAWELEAQADTAYGKFLLAAMTKKGEKGKYTLDEDIQKRYLSGEISNQEMSRIGARKLRGDITLFGKAMYDPKRLREEIMPDDNQYFPMISKSLDKDIEALMDSNRRMSKEQATFIATNRRASSPEEGKDFRKFLADAPTREVVNREAESKERVDKAIEKATKERGLMALSGRALDTVLDHSTGWFSRQVGNYVVDPAVNINNRFIETANDLYMRKALGLRITNMPGAAPEGYTSPGQLSSESEGGVNEIVSQTSYRAGKTKTKEEAASVWAQKISDRIEGFGSSAWGKDARLGGVDVFGVVKSPGEKLIGMGAYEHLGSYMAAQEAVLGGESKDGLKKISGKYKFNEDDTRLAEQYYDTFKEMLEQRKCTLEELTKNNREITALQKELRKTGAGQAGAAYPMQEADYPEDASGYMEAYRSSVKGVGYAYGTVRRVGQSAYGAVSHASRSVYDTVRGAEDDKADRKVWDELEGKFVTSRKWDEAKGGYVPSPEFEKMERSRREEFGAGIRAYEQSSFNFDPPVDVSKINESADLEVKDSGKGLWERYASASVGQKFDFEQTPGDMAFPGESDVHSDAHKEQAKQEFDFEQARPGESDIHKPKHAKTKTRMSGFGEIYLDDPEFLEKRRQRIAEHRKGRSVAGGDVVLADMAKDRIEGFGLADSGYESQAGGVKIKGSVGGLASPKTPGAELLGMGASSHLGSYVAALSSAKGDGDIEKVSEKYKLSPEETKKARELYEKIEEFKKQKRVTEEAIIEQLASMTKLYTDMSKSGAKPSRGAGGYGRDVLHASPGGTGRPVVAPTTHHTGSPLGEKVSKVEKAVGVHGKEVERAASKNKDSVEHAERIEHATGAHRASIKRLADHRGKAATPLVEEVSEIEKAVDVHGEAVDRHGRSEASKDKRSLRIKGHGTSYKGKGVAQHEPDDHTATPSPLGAKVSEVEKAVAPTRTGAAVGGTDAEARLREQLKKYPMGSDDWQTVADQLNYGKSKLTKEDHDFTHKGKVMSKEDFAKKGMVGVAEGKGKKKFVEADTAHRYRGVVEQAGKGSGFRAGSILETNFDVWRAKWSRINYSDVSPAVVVGGAQAEGSGGSKLTPDTTGHDLWENAGSNVMSKDGFARKGMVDVGGGRWVSASMAQYYGKKTPSTPAYSQDVVAKDTGVGVKQGEEAATKALGSSQGGLASSAEKTAKTLDKVAKSAENFMGKFSSLLLGARNSNNNACY